MSKTRGARVSKRESAFSKTILKGYRWELVVAADIMLVVVASDSFLTRKTRGLSLAGRRLSLCTLVSLEIDSILTV